MVTTRAIVDKSLLLREWPHRALGRGDKVTFWEGGRKKEGTVLAYDSEGQTIIKHRYGETICDPNFLTVSTPALDPAWEDLDADATCRPTQVEQTSFNEVLENAMYLGVSVIQMMQELKNKGHEILVVGGTVRDVIGGEHFTDLDLAGTMGVNAVFDLYKYIFKTVRDPIIQNGYLWIQGSYQGDSVGIDYCSLQLFRRGKKGNVRFDHSIRLDSEHRDFACNAVYYSPFNNVLVDPTHFGIEDAESKTLRPVWNDEDKDSSDLAKIGIRFFKFINRGYSPGDGCKEKILDRLDSILNAFGSEELIRFIRRQVVRKNPDNGEEELEKLAKSFKDLGKGKEWRDYIAPHRAQILAGP